MLVVRAGNNFFIGKRIVDMQNITPESHVPGSSEPAPAVHGHLIMTNESVDVWSAPITARKQTIGRRKDCDIVVPPKFICVSRLHAYVWADKTGAKISDQGSTAGTRVNGVEIRPHTETPIVTGDRITLGILELRLVDDLPAQRRMFSEGEPAGDESMDSVDPSLLENTTARSQLAKLTKAEFAIVLWIGRGYFKDEEIAKHLHRSPNTIRTQVNSIFRKLNVHSRTDLVNLIRNPQKGGDFDPQDTAVL